MQERVKTSFIPKASLKVERSRPQRSGGGTIGIFNIIAVFLLVLAVIGAVGVFGYEQYLKGSISGKRTSLERARAAFEPATIKELSRLNARLSVGEELLNQHRSYSRVFDEIEVLTLDSVRFSDFTLDETSPGLMTVSMSGAAASFNSLALQADSFGKSRIIQEPVFSDFNVDQFGSVVFSFVGTLNVSELGYTPSLSSSPQTPPPPVTEEPEEEEGTTEASSPAL